MAADDLTAPLGQEIKRGSSFPAAIAASMPQAVAIALATFLGAFVLWAVIADNPFGGEPIAVVQISPPGPMAPRVIGGPAAREYPATPGPNAAGADESGPGRYDGPADGSINIPAPSGLPAPPSPGMTESPANGVNTRTVTIIDGKNSARQEVASPGSSEPPDTPSALTTPETPSAALSEAQPNDQKKFVVRAVRTLSCSRLFKIQLAPGLPARGRSFSQQGFTLSSENPLPWCYRRP
jgi:hypothetical protein